MRIALLVLLLPILVFGEDVDLGDHPNFAHAMQVETREVDAYPVVFQFGQVRPDFSITKGNAHRQRGSLDGPWDFRFEGDRVTRTVEVPHSWEAMSGSNFWDMDRTSSRNPAQFNGAGWYRKEFNCEKKPDRRYRLEFRGVRERARVYFNNTEIAQHEGIGAPFSIDITPHIQSGKNEIRLKVLRLNNHRKNEAGKWEETGGIHTPYPKAPDYWPYAGITGSVILWEESATTIRKIQVRTADEQLAVAVVVSNHSDSPFEGTLSLKSQVFKEQPALRKISLPAGSVRVLQFSEMVLGSTKRWSPAEPALHHLEATLATPEEAIDSSSVRFGLREFQVDGLDLKLNDESVFLKGASAYNETPEGAAVEQADHRTIFKLAKEADLNFIRLAVRQRSPDVYRLADEAGIMVSGEWGGFWYLAEAMAAQTKDARSIYQSMARVAVWDLMNHPSVVLWCLNNECDQFCPEYESFLKMGRELVRELDGGLLPITWAAWHPHKGTPHFEYADIVGFNEYRGALDPFKDLAPDMELVTQNNPDKPIVIMENGSWSTLGSRGSANRRGTEDWQAGLITRQWDILKTHRPQLSGYIHWLLKDYRTRRAYTATKRKDGWNRMGIYSEKGEPKLARDVLRDIEMK